jgi:ribosomal protein S18 acetylase RimI-like enzyme
MRVDNAGMSDVDNLKVFFHRAWEESGPDRLGFTGATEETIDEITSDAFLKKRLSNPDVIIYVVREGRAVLGFASTRKIDPDAIELSGIIMLESATGKGFGTQLVERAVGSARQAGFHRMVVKTEAVNGRAIGFYKKMGFAEVGKTWETVEGTAVDVMILEMAL